jgi:hypothetical protein
MTQEEYIDLFHRAEVNLVAFKPVFHCDDELRKMVEMAIEKEREACADIKNILHPMNFGGKQSYTVQELLDHMKTGILEYSNAIKARGQA